jgi:putative sterol carrier protein/multimeric flavodoxin WrbA
MKILFLNGNMPHFDYGLQKVVRFTRDIFTELGIETDEINLSYSQIPYFDGIKAQATDDAVLRIREAEGIVLASTAQLFAPTAILQTFFEYMMLDEYNDAFRGKHFLLLAVSRDGGERSAINYMSRIVQHLGGYDSVIIGLQETHTRALETDNEIRGFIEKETEDFYRALRQERKYIIPRDNSCRESISSMTAADVASWSQTGDKKEKIPVSEIIRKHNMNAFEEQQEKDIQELTRFFAEKYASPDAPQSAAPVFPQVSPLVAPVKPRQKTIRQITQSLPHYFQPQLSNGLNAVVQFNITGTESFDGYLTIQSTECNYTDGTATNPDITVIADTDVWGDVMRHKFTAQKAFMIGGLKVRGNFVLLTKFDTLFKLG